MSPHPSDVAIGPDQHSRTGVGSLDFGKACDVDRPRPPFPDVHEPRAALKLRQLALRQLDFGGTRAHERVLTGLDQYPLADGVTFVVVGVEHVVVGAREDRFGSQ